MNRVDSRRNEPATPRLAILGEFTPTSAPHAATNAAIEDSCAAYGLDSFGVFRWIYDAGIYATSSYEVFIGGSSDNEDGSWTRPNPPRSGIGVFGRYTFEINDARQIAEWGFDYFITPISASGACGPRR